MSLTALLVCPDAKAVEVLGRILKDLGISVEACGERTKALAKVAQSRYDALLVDCHEERTTTEVLAAARKSPENKTTLVVAMVDGQTNVRDVFARGANFVLYKPVSTERAKNSLRAARALMRRERRRHGRVPVHAEAAIDCANIASASVTLIDLSEEGTAIQCDRRLPPSCKVYFQFSLPGQVTTVRLSGEVVWQDSTGRVGIRFAGVPQASRRVLNEWLKTNVGRGVGSASLPPELPAQAPAGFGLLAVSASDRRIQSRHACRLGADLYRAGVNVPHRCSLSDISTGGCYVESTSPFPAGTPVEIVVRTREMKIHLKGAVLAMHPGFGMGVRFHLRTAEERDHVQTLIALLAESQSSEPGMVVEPWARG
jgi:CheY-like chemotaxis protein